jgi:alpha-L-rhamnosidase
MKRILLAVLMQMILIVSFAQIKVVSTLTDNQINPIGVGNRDPRFTWIMSANKRNTFQKAYQVQVFEGKSLVWNSGKTISDQCVFVQYNGLPLQSNKKYTWRVKVWEDDKNGSEWSSLSKFQTALLDVGEKSQFSLPHY